MDPLAVDPLNIPDAELDELFAARKRLAAMSGVRASDRRGRRDKHRDASPDEGREFERHTIGCSGCAYCRPARGTR